MHNCELFGYLVSIDETTSLTVSVFSGEVFCIRQAGGQNVYASFRPGQTTMRLLTYLLTCASGKIVCNRDLLLHVWDLHGLRSSNQRLNHTMLKLVNALYQLGCPPDFIQHYPREGYTVGPYPIRALYARPVPGTIYSDSKKTGLRVFSSCPVLAPGI